jgi:hypothetical protein
MSLQGIGGGPFSLDIGLPLTLINGVAASQTTGALPSATTTNVSTNGVAPNPTFSVPSRGDSGDRTINLNARGVGGSLTALTVDLYASTDSGASWQLYEGDITLVTGGVSTDSQALHVVSGVLYCLIAKTVTLNTATAVDVDGSLS